MTTEFGHNWGNSSVLGLVIYPLLLIKESMTEFEDPNHELELKLKLPIMHPEISLLDRLNSHIKTLQLGQQAWSEVQ